MPKDDHQQIFGDEQHDLLVVDTVLFHFADGFEKKLDFFDGHGYHLLFLGRVLVTLCLLHWGP